MTRTTSRYLLELTGSFLLYAALLIGANLLERAWHPTGAAKVGLALLPMLGAGTMVVAVMRQLRRLDELQRRVQFEAIGFAFAVTALLTFGYGFLETAGLPRFPIFAVWPLMAVSWIAGTMISARRYR